MAALALLVAAAAPASAQATRAHAELRDASGTVVGRATLQQVERGVLIDLSLAGAPAGVHALHIHGVGKCDAPFTSAGGHWNPSGVPHGLLTPRGGHAGDLPNIDIPASGTLHIQVLADGARLAGSAGMLDADGATLMLHAGADDYTSDPAGAAGPRVACGVITAD